MTESTNARGVRPSGVRKRGACVAAAGVHRQARYQRKRHREDGDHHPQSGLGLRSPRHSEPQVTPCDAA